MTAAIETRPPRRLVRSILAVFAGFVAVVALSMGADEAMYALHVFPPRSQPMEAPALYALALAYRSVFGVTGSWIAAALAPSRPMRHALIVGGIGLALSLVAAVVVAGNVPGPAWFAWGLVASTLPCAWLGGLLHRARS